MFDRSDSFGHGYDGQRCARCSSSALAGETVAIATSEFHKIYRPSLPTNIGASGGPVDSGGRKASIDLRQVKPHLLFCTDLVSRNAAGDRVTQLQGWCLGSVPVQALFLKTGTGEFESLAHGFPRADVAKAFPAYPRSQWSGFKLFHEFDGKPGALQTL